MIYTDLNVNKLIRGNLKLVAKEKNPFNLCNLWQNFISPAQ